MSVNSAIGSSGPYSSSIAAPAAPLSPSVTRANTIVGHLVPNSSSHSPDIIPINVAPTASSSPPPSTAASSPSSSSSALRPPFAVPTPVSAAAPQLLIRYVEAGDYHKGHCALLSQLTTLGTVSESDYATRIQLMARASNTFHTLVIEDMENHSIIASATLIVEWKLLHSCGAAGHIEDVVVKDGYRGKNLGAAIIQSLHQVAKYHGCYKVMLDCKDHNVAFYEKLGYHQSEKHMRIDFSN